MKILDQNVFNIKKEVQYTIIGQLENVIIVFNKKVRIAALSSGMEKRVILLSE